MSDIRNYFAARGGAGGGQGNLRNVPAAKVKDAVAVVKNKEVRRPKPLISDSSEDEDFDHDFRRGDKKSGGGTKPPKAKKLATVVEAPAKAAASGLKPIDAKDFFASASSGARNGGTGTLKGSGGFDTRKRKSKQEQANHDDPDFVALLGSMDDEGPADKDRGAKRACTSTAKGLPTGSRQQTEVPRPLKGSLEAKPSREVVPDRKGPLESDLKVKDRKGTLESDLKVKPSREVVPDRKEPLKGNSPVKPSREVVPDRKGALESNSQVKPSREVVPDGKGPLEIKPQFKPSREVVPDDDSSKETELWVDKYRPVSVKAIIGQQGDKSNVKKLTNWLQNWDKRHRHRQGKPGLAKPPPWHAANDDGAWAKAALLSGPPGVGKTTTAHLVAKELGYDVVELNASDARSKKQLEAQLGDSLDAKAVADTSLRRVLLMDEVDGMAGNEDRGGVGELISLFKRSKIPVICMCNDRNHPKIRNLANHCFDLRFQRPRVDQIRAAMMSVCFKEKVKVNPDALTQLIVGCNHDVRQVLHHLTMMKAKAPAEAAPGSVAAEVGSMKTSIKLGPWDVCRKVFTASEHHNMTLMDKSDLFFHDYSLSPLFVQENYLSVVPAAAKDKAQTMLLVSKAAESICYGDLVERTIRSDNAWNLLPVEAIFASVIPGEYMAGYMSGQIQFPSWLGKNSKQNKLNRILQELQVHVRMKAGLSKTALNQDFVQFLRDSIVGPMVRDKLDGIRDSVEVMKEYTLLREDLEGLLELSQWSSGEDPMKGVDSKVKAAFTRTYNKEVVLPYASNTAAKKGAAGKRGASDTDYVLAGEEEDLEEDNDVEDEDDDDAIEADSMIKAKKPRVKGSSEVATASASTSKAGKATSGAKPKGRKAQKQ